MKRKSRAYSPPLNLIFHSINILLTFVIFFLVFSLIKERVYLEKNKYLVNKYRTYLSQILSSNYLILSSFDNKPTDPSSSTNLIYLTPETISYLENSNN